MVMDLFIGTGILLSSVNDLIKPSGIIGIEINKEPCALAWYISVNIPRILRLFAVMPLSLRCSVGLILSSLTHPSLGGA